jgi:hypothetical protein
MNNLDRPAVVITPQAVRAGVTGQHLRVVLATGMALTIVAMLLAALLV